MRDTAILWQSLGSTDVSPDRSVDRIPVADTTDRIPDVLLILYGSLISGCAFLISPRSWLDLFYDLGLHHGPHNGTDARPVPIDGFVDLGLLAHLVSRIRFHVYLSGVGAPAVNRTPDCSLQVSCYTT